MATNYILFLIVLLIFYYLCKQIVKRERYSEEFQDTIKSEDPMTSKKEKTDKTLEEKSPAEVGLVFGFLPEKIQQKKFEYKIDSNAVYGGSSISLSSKNLYLGMSEKNPLLPIFLERLGTFKPYEYSTTKIHVKDEDFNQNAALEDIILEKSEPKPIFYNKSIVCFTVKYNQDNYFIQYIPNTSTFYLTNKPSYFNLVNAMDINTEFEVKYGENCIVRCLDNSELLLLHDSFIITEANRSSLFTINKMEGEDLCINFNKSNVDLTNFLPQFISPRQSDSIFESNKEEVNRYLQEAKKNSNSIINSIKANLILLEQKKANLILKTQIGLEQKRSEYKNVLDKEKKKVDLEIKKYEKELSKELEDYKIKLGETKGKEWEGELVKFEKDIKTKCKLV